VFVTEFENTDDKTLWQRFIIRFVDPPVARILRASKKRHFRELFRFFLFLASLVTVYALIFQVLMNIEGQRHSIVTGFYWTLSTMSTLGYGDVSFTSDTGRIFSILVLLSGIIFMLVLLPFTFMELFWVPWTESRAAKLVPRRVPENLHGHVILTFYGPVASALIEKLVQYHYLYVVILPDAEEVTRLNDLGVFAICGDLNDPETYLRARVEHAALVATTRDDISNTSVVFTVRGITNKTPVIASVREESSVGILKLAGCSRVLELTELMAESLARRAIGGNSFSHVVGQIDDLLIAEVEADRTKLVGKSYLEAQWETSISIVGFWARGHFQIGQQDSVIESNCVLVMAGSKKQLSEFDAKYRADHKPSDARPVIIIGGGRVGRSTAAALKRRGIDYRIVEILEERVRDKERYILGSGADRLALEKAGILDAHTIIITTGADETNIYLTINCRLLRPDIQIITRTTFDRNVSALHRAGSDIVMSYASMGSNALFNLLHRSDLLMIAEGLDVFKVRVPRELAGKTLAETNFRKATNCSVIGIDTHDKTMTNPGPETVLPAGAEIVLIGTPQGESEFLRLFPAEDIEPV
jgi:voltage-gated potassium channel